MGNIIPVVALIIMFGGIMFYLIKSLKTKGTTCTSCTNCPHASKIKEYKQ